MSVFQKTKYLLLSLVLAFNAHAAQSAILQQQLLGTGLSSVFDQRSSGNNNCLYDAVSDQLSHRGLQQFTGPALRQRSEGAIEQEIRNLQHRYAWQVIDRKRLYQEQEYRKGDQGVELNIASLAKSLNVNIVVISTQGGVQEFLARPAGGLRAPDTVYIGHDGGH